MVGMVVVEKVAGAVEDQALLCRRLMVAAVMLRLGAEKLRSPGPAPKPAVISNVPMPRLRGVRIVTFPAALSVRVLSLSVDCSASPSRKMELALSVTSRAVVKMILPLLESPTPALIFKVPKMLISVARVISPLASKIKLGGLIILPAGGESGALSEIAPTTLIVMSLLPSKLI